MLLAAAWKRLLVACVAVAALWAAVLWVAPSAPSTAPAQPSVHVAARPPQSDQQPNSDRCAPSSDPVSQRLAAAASIGSMSPGSRSLAPVNARGQVAFYATVLRALGREGIFLAEAGRISKGGGVR